MSENVVTSDPTTADARPRKGKQVHATDLLGRLGDVSLQRIERHEPTILDVSPPTTTSEPPTVPPIAGGGEEAPPQERRERRPRKPREEPTPAHRPKPTALKLPAGITEELRAAMVYLRKQGLWDVSMSQIAQAGIRKELDLIKADHKIESFPPVVYFPDDE